MEEYNNKDKFTNLNKKGDVISNELYNKSKKENTSDPLNLNPDPSKNDEYNHSEEAERGIYNDPRKFTIPEVNQEPPINITPRPDTPKKVGISGPYVALKDTQFPPEVFNIPPYSDPSAMENDPDAKDKYPRRDMNPNDLNKSDYNYNDDYNQKGM